jgi:hypothetical protein
VEDGASWFEGTVDATAAVFNDDPNVMFFFSNTDSQFLGLAGSAHHIIGNLRPETAVSSHSNLPTLLQALDSLATRQASLVRGGDDVALDNFVHAGLHDRSLPEIMLDISSQFDRQPRTPVSFLARRLIYDGYSTNSDGQRKRITVGTPLYITADDIFASLG